MRRQLHFPAALPPSKGTPNLPLGSERFGKEKCTAPVLSVEEMSLVDGKWRQYVLPKRR